MACGVALTVVLLGALVSIDDPWNQPEWQYDDYVVIEDATAVSGSLEFIESGGVRYVHAHSLGPGTITREDGTVDEINVSRAHLDVFLMTGQSNAAYFNAEGTVDPSTASPVPPLGTSYYYGFEDKYDRLTSGTPEFMSMTNSDGGAVIGDKAPPFAATYYEQTGHKVYWICGAVSGTTIDQFVPGTGDVWDYMEEVVPAALDAIDTKLYIPHAKGYMWIQGEWNKETAVDVYKSDFLAMHDAILSGDLGMRFDHCFISLVASGNAVTAQRELAETYASISISTDVASTFTQNNGLLGDGVHYSQAGDNIIGVALGQSVADYYNAEAEKMQPLSQLTSAVPMLIVVGLLITAISIIAARRY